MQHSQRFFWTVSLFLGLLGFFAPVACRAQPTLEFTATTDTVALETDILCNADFTVEYWLRSTNSTAYAVIHNSTNNNYAVRHDSYGWICKIGVGYPTQNSGLLFANPAVTFYVSDNLEDNAWTHVVITRDATNSLQVTLNGVSVGNARTWTGQLRIDRIGGGLLGAVSDVRVWDHARSDAEIAFNRYRRLNGTESGLLGYWPLDDATGTTAQDLSPAANDGTLLGASWASDAALDFVANDNAFVPSEPLTVADFETDSAEFTNSNGVNVVSFPIPPDVDQYQITLTADPNDLSFAVDAWTNTSAPPVELTFPTPEGDEDVVFYVWFTNSVDSVALRRATGTIRYTTAMPSLAARTTLARETAGFTVRLLPKEFDLGSTGGTTGSKAIPIHRLELVDLTDPAADETPAQDYRTLPATAGTYSFALRVINAAGNAALSAPCTVTLANTSALPVGNRYVVIGNLNADDPYNTWETAAADIQTAVDKAAADEVIYIARGTYQGSGAQIVLINKPLQLIGAHPREEVILDGGDGAFGNRKGIAATMPLPIDSAPLLRIENLTVTRCVDQQASGTSGQGIRIDHRNVTNGTAIIRNCVVSENRILKGDGFYIESGAGFYAEGVTDSAFHVELSHSRFEANFSIGRIPTGVGAGLRYGRVTIETCEFLGNAGMGQRTQEGNSRTASGGGVGIVNATAGSWIRDCLFEDNWIGVGGYGGGVDLLSGDSVTIENSIFRSNQSGYVGAVRFNTSNTATTTNLLRNCLVVGNRASSWGGGVASGTTSGTTVLIENCTIADNVCSSVSGGGGGIQGYLVVRNSIIRDNTPNNGNYFGTGIRSYYHCCSSPIKTESGNTFVIGNIAEDPLYVDAPGGDYRLTPASPCRDAGLNQDWMFSGKDLDNKPRLDIWGTTVDIGAYEYLRLGTLMQLR